MKRINWRYVAELALVAVVYAATAKLGLMLAVSTQQVTTVWPPTGIALVVLLLWGYKYWPAIAVGAFAANVMTHESALVAAGIAVGNTLEALAGAYLLKRLAKLEPRRILSSVRGVVSFLVLAVLASTMVSATIGTLSLGLGGLMAWGNYIDVWVVWWIGDVMGSLLVAPALLVAMNTNYWRALWARKAEAAGLVAATLAVSLFIFTARSGGLLPYTPFPYLAFPVLIWAALRFRQIGVVLCMAIVAPIAVWATVTGLGPFSKVGVGDVDLVILQLYLFTASSTSLILAAAESERWRAIEALQRANIRAADILAEVLDDSLPRRPGKR